MLRGYNPYLSNKNNWQIIFSFFTQIYRALLIQIVDDVVVVGNIFMRGR